MHKLLLPKLIIDVFKESNNKNIIQHFIDKDINIEFEEFENYSHYIVINYNQSKYCLTKSDPATLIHTWNLKTSKLK